MNILPSLNFKAIFEAIPGLYLILLPDLTIIELSDAYAEATMIKRNDVIGKNIFEVFPDNPNDAVADGVSNLRASLHWVLKNKMAHTMAVQKYDIRKPNGEFEARYWSPLNKPILNEEDDVLYIIHRAEDVTSFVQMKHEQDEKDIATSELKELLKEKEIEIYLRAQEIQKMNTDLEKKVEIRTQYLSDAYMQIQKNLKDLSGQKKQLEDFCNIISHNLRGPLVNISMLVDFLLKSADEDEKSDLISKLNITASNLNETFNQLVDSLQIQDGVDVKSKSLSFATHIQLAIDGLQGQIKKTDANFIIKVDDAPMVNFPEKYLMSLLHNLLSNALKYSVPGRKPLIVIETLKLNNSILLSVSDNGLGIDLNKHRDNLFKIKKVFHKHPDAKGFGLFITKSQIESQGGKIWIESTPMEGSTFYVEFKN